MTKKGKIVAFDIGAASGRTITGHFHDDRLVLEEIHRFPIYPVQLQDSLYIDVLNIWQQIQIGLQKSIEKYGSQIDSVGVDTWGVDYALLDKKSRLLSNPYHYRDNRTNAILERACEKVSLQDVYFQTGNYPLQFNTLFQLYTTRLEQPYLLDEANSLMMLPDLFNFWLCGEKATEYSIATTTQCFDQVQKKWAHPLLRKLDIPTGIFQQVLAPGTSLGKIHSRLTPDDNDASIQVILPACHDTASAVSAVPLDDPNYLYISSGTWSLVGVELSQPLLRTENMEAEFTNEGSPENITRFLKIVPGMWLLQQCKREWELAGKYYTYDDLTQIAAEVRTARSIIDVTDPLFTAPGPMCERIRYYCLQTGQCVPRTEGEMVKCILISLSFLYRSLLDNFETILQKRINVIHIIGGGSKNALLNQMTADNCSRPVIAGPQEATATGNILVQAMGLGYVNNLNEIRQIVKRSINPITFYPVSSQIWDEDYARYKKYCTNYSSFQKQEDFIR